MNSKINPAPRRTSSLWALRGLAGGLALALALTPFLSPPCSGSIFEQSSERCQITFQAELLLAALSVLTAGGLWLDKALRTQASLGAGLAVLGILAVLVPQPFLLGLCRNPDMACHEGARWLWLWAGLQILAGATIPFASRKRTQDESLPDPWENGSPDFSEEQPANSRGKTCCD